MKYIFIFILCLFCQTSYAQFGLGNCNESSTNGMAYRGRNRTVSTDNWIFSLGTGQGFKYFVNFKDNDIRPAFFINIEKGFLDFKYGCITGGLFVGYLDYSVTGGTKSNIPTPQDYTFEWRWKVIPIASNVEWHHDFGFQGLDVFAGICGGVYLSKFEEKLEDRIKDSTVPWGYKSPTDQTFNWDVGITMGLGYYFTENIGAFGRVGNTLSPMMIGLRIKL